MGSCFSAGRSGRLPWPGIRGDIEWLRDVWKGRGEISLGVGVLPTGATLVAGLVQLLLRVEKWMREPWDVELLLGGAGKEARLVWPGYRQTIMNGCGLAVS